MNLESKFTIIIVIPMLLSQPAFGAEALPDLTFEWNITNITQEYSKLRWSTRGYFEPVKYTVETGQTVDDRGNTGNYEYKRYINNEFTTEFNSEDPFPDYQSILDDNQILNENVDGFYNDDPIGLELNDLALFILPTIVRFDNGSSIDIFATIENFETFQPLIVDFLDLSLNASFEYRVEMADDGTDLISIHDQGQDYNYLISGILEGYTIDDDPDNTVIEFISRNNIVVDDIAAPISYFVPLSTIIIASIVIRFSRKKKSL